MMDGQRHGGGVWARWGRLAPRTELTTLFPPPFPIIILHWSPRTTIVGEKERKKQSSKFPFPPVPFFFHFLFGTFHPSIRPCHQPESMLHLRCVLVGDPCVGKTSLIVSYTRNGFCERYCPTAFDNYSVTVCVDGTPLRLELCDTAGRSEFDSIRPLSYADASVFLLCFSVAKLSSLNSATQRWLPEIRALAPTAPILLVGTQSDRRLSSQRGVLIEPGVTSQLAGHLQLNCLECSAVTQQNLKEVFDLAILHALCHQRRMVRQPDDCGVGLLLAAKERAVTCEKGVKQAKAPNGGNGLKQNFWRLVAITKKFM